MQNGSLAKMSIIQGRYQSVKIFNQYHELLVIGDWKRVAVVDWNNNDHLNSEAVKDVKLSDQDINELMVKGDIWCQVDAWRSPYNSWLPWPHDMFVHDIEFFSSVIPANKIKNASRLSYGTRDNPVECDMTFDNSTLGFGFAAGDTFWGYGDWNKPGFTQHFSGAGRGAVYVR